MARRSASSSAPQASGHATTPAAPASNASAPSQNDADLDLRSVQYEARTRPFPFDPTLSRNGQRSLASIGLQAFFLGFTLAACLLSTVWLVSHRYKIWRLPTFFACLSLFHFLEYWTTASFNAAATRASSFLLFSNGAAYNVAHTLAALEILVSNFIPSYQCLGVNAYTVTAGIALVVLGQIVRSVAMAQAGTNFNHLPQKVRREGHILVTTGVYRWLRHPSYFGFFWWAFGTQILVGNKICCVGYLLALWRFFSRRITGEEETLVEFFGDDYEAYRARTRTGIPFIR